MSGGEEFKFSEEVNTLTAHGISRVFQSQSTIGKIFWFCIWLGTSSACIYYTITMANLHKSHQVHTAQNKKLNTEMVFPAITFCDTNHYDDTQHQIQSLERLPNSCNQSLNDSYFANDKDKLYFNRACKMFLAEGSLPAFAMGFESWSFPKHFTVQHNIGPCFTLNKDKTLKQTTLPGISTGMSMLLYYNESDIAKDPSLTVGSPIITDQRGGLLLSVHDQGYFAQGLFENGIELQAGYHTSIVLKKSEIKRKPSPFPSNCIHDGEEGYLKLFPGRHNVFACTVSCYYLKIYQICGFLPTIARPLFAKLKNKFPETKNLTAKERHRCYKHVYENEITVEGCKCQKPCNEVVYYVKVIRKRWPPKWLAKKYLKLFAQFLNITASELHAGKIREHFMKISIYFEEFSTQIIEEEELYSLASFMSDFGGLLGLYLGMSIISIVEFISLATNCIKRRLSGQKKTLNSVKP